MIFLPETIVAHVSTCAEDPVVRRIHFQAGDTMSFFSFTGRRMYQTVIGKLRATIGGLFTVRRIAKAMQWHCYLGVLGRGTCSNPPDQVDITLSALVLWHCRKEHEM